MSAAISAFCAAATRPIFDGEEGMELVHHRLIEHGVSPDVRRVMKMPVWVILLAESKSHGFTPIYEHVPRSMISRLRWPEMMFSFQKERP